MPGMSGLDARRVLKSQPATKRTPVIFVTALADSSDETEGFEAGAVDYIAKPVSPPVVRARVRTHLSLVRADEPARDAAADRAAAGPRGGIQGQRDRPGMSSA